MSVHTLTVVPPPKKKRVNLRKLPYSPRVNPLLRPKEVGMTPQRSEGLVRSGISIGTADNGQQVETAFLLKQELVNEETFVKMHLGPLKEWFELSLTAWRVLLVIWGIYKGQKVNQDWVPLFWFDNGIEGCDEVDMKEKTFQRGMRELLERDFIAPRDKASFWIDPSRFFKGDRVMLVRELIKTKTIEGDTGGNEKINVAGGVPY